MAIKTINMKENEVYVTIPKSRYDELLRESGSTKRNEIYDALEKVKNGETNIIIYEIEPINKDWVTKKMSAILFTDKNIKEEVERFAKYSLDELPYIKRNVEYLTTINSLEKRVRELENPAKEFEYPGWLKKLNTFKK